MILAALRMLSRKLRQRGRRSGGVPTLSGATGVVPVESPHDGATGHGGSIPPASTFPWDPKWPHERHEWVQRWVPSLWRSDQLGKEKPNEYDENRDLIAHPDWTAANLAGSVVDHGDDALLEGHLHHVVIDLDHPATLVPSTQPDHGHLYVRLPRPVEWDTYLAWLEASAAIGLISRNYLRHCKVRKSSMVRLPWIKKEPKRDPRTGAATFGWVGMSSEGDDEDV